MDEQLTFNFDQKPTIKGFPELRWTGKRPYRSTQYYPAQLRESYGEEQNGWMNKIFWGDNLQVMSHLLKEYRGKVDLIYIDPPFDSKADYKKKIDIRGIGKAESDSSSFEEKQYGDIWTNDEYLQFMYERLTILRELLSEQGSIFLHCDWHKSHHLRCLLEEVFGSANFRNEIIWENQGAWVNSDSWFPRRHNSLLFFSKSSDYKFNVLNDDDISGGINYNRWYNYIVNNRIYADNAPYHDSRFTTYVNRFEKNYGRKPQNKDIIVDFKGSVLGSVWYIKVVDPKSPENVSYPTQKPEALLERIIKALTNPGDLVFDCFMGSGTTQAVAMKLGRRFIGADINLGAIQTTTKRLLSIAEELKPANKPMTYKMVQPQYSMAADNRTSYTADPSKKNTSQSNDKIIEFSKANETESASAEGNIKYTGFEVYNVNNYDFFRNPVEARDLLIAALEIQPFPKSDVWDGELDGRMVKIMPVNRIATKADLKELLANLPYKTYEKRKAENPGQPVERITIVCMGHEPDLKGALEQELTDYKVDVQIVDILRDKSDLQLKRDSEAEIVREGDKLVIRAFYPMNLMQKLSIQKEYVEDWRQLVDSIMIDWNYDGVVMQPSVMDIPNKNEMVKGIYDIPEGCGTIKVKITDLLSESLEVEVR
ncbi:site-specific DNA-methyltransferase [Fibrobacter sp. UWP2]|uniref:site-specific DNA-methyltransferase n=1 Tax=Fibrobacter sp. UWP2 TaxID=1896216 RepID=UPI00091D040B|nr:site-specific DNA-methyltransferase [Fibrobacter sp. UWP2]SHI81782.1 adenine-specific DNA-methyltransferase [Fibrobacter sp. UWP2]